VPNSVLVPRAAHKVVDVLLPIVSPATKSIARIYGHDKSEWSAEILKSIDPGQIPPQFGGNKISTHHHV
jgi:hypothetical protein